MTRDESPSAGPGSPESPLLREIQQLRSRLEEAYATIEVLLANRTSLEEDVLHLRRIAATDELTGLWNRRFLVDSLDISFSFAIRHRLPLSLVLLDVDHFKTFNDGFGHAAGDVILRDVASLIQSCARNHDVVARYGGEEFAILLPGTDRLGADSVAERVRRTIEEHGWSLQTITASLGSATLNHEGELTPRTVSALVETADLALYHSKRQGRNRVTHADELMPKAAVATHGAASRVGY
ncbi:GGDEF domain-containing protein [Paludisphaera rhizosphaerae]|uniref:GGDEF domain-containing protein n=1 Tax=Paludisphaera rhizosphaerae TaxID=2711216 RepID=UPI0013EBA7ED|nr:GGDEF domain-containing protein [Paludisphaera rhizosphaerae]